MGIWSSTDPCFLTSSMKECCTLGREGGMKMSPAWYAFPFIPKSLLCSRRKSSGLAIPLVSIKGRVVSERWKDLETFLWVMETRNSPNRSGYFPILWIFLQLGKEIKFYDYKFKYFLLIQNLNKFCFLFYLIFKRDFFIEIKSWIFYFKD